MLSLLILKNFFQLINQNQMKNSDHSYEQRILQNLKLYFIILFLNIFLMEVKW